MYPLIVLAHGKFKIPSPRRAGYADGLLEKTAKAINMLLVRIHNNCTNLNV